MVFQDSPAYVQQIPPGFVAPRPQASPAPQLLPAPRPPPSPAPAPPLRGWRVQVASTPPAYAMRAREEARARVAAPLDVQARGVRVRGRERVRLSVGPFATPQLALAWCAGRDPPLDPCLVGAGSEAPTGTTDALPRSTAKLKGAPP